MRVLGVDTSSAHASVAVAENGRLIGEKFHRPAASITTRAPHSRNNHAEVLLPLIESALAEAALTLSDISGFAVAIGPGSFTGLRIGLSTVQGLAYGSGVPVTGVSTLHAVAGRISDFNGVVCAILDARKKEMYAAMFGRSAGALERLTDDTVMSCDKLGELLRRVNSQQPVLLTGDGTATYGERLLASLGSRVRICPGATSPTVAAAVALLGESHFTRGAPLSQASLAPHYVRPAEPELSSPKSP